MRTECFGFSLKVQIGFVAREIGRLKHRTASIASPTFRRASRGRDPPCRLCGLRWISTPRTLKSKRTGNDSRAQMVKENLNCDKNGWRDNNQWACERASGAIAVLLRSGRRSEGATRISVASLVSITTVMSRTAQFLFCKTSAQKSAHASHHISTLSAVHSRRFPRCPPGPTTHRQAACS